MLDIFALKNLMRALRVENGNFSIGQKDDSKIISVFKRGDNFVVRLKDTRGMVEEVFENSDEEKACISFLENLAFSL